MGKVSAAIKNVYKAFLPLAENCHIQLNLDLGEDDIQVEDASVLEPVLSEHLNSALARTKSHQNTEIKIGLHNGKITISDSGSTLSKPVCNALSGKRVKVKSRLGFGTKVTIDLTPREAEETQSSQSSKTTKSSKSAKS